MNGQGRMHRIGVLLAGAVALYFASASGFAQVRYVSDELVITFRTGPGSQFAITRNLIELMQGKLEITSEVGKGSIFQFSLPVAAEE